MIDVSVRLSRGASLPRYASEQAAAFDLCAMMDEEALTLAPGARCRVPTGIAIAIGEPGFAGFCFARSGLATKHGVALCNGVGVIDADYRGEIEVGLVNCSDSPYTIKRGERVAQLCILPVASARLLAVEELPETVRGAGGFGSTGL